MDAPTDPLRRRAATVASLVHASRAVGSDLADAFALPTRSLASGARAGAFWASILLPCVHIPLLVIAGFNSSTALPLFALWAAHALVLVVGARHRPTRKTR